MISVIVFEYVKILLIWGLVFKICLISLVFGLIKLKLKIFVCKLCFFKILLKFNVCLMVVIKKFGFLKIVKCLELLLISFLVVNLLVVIEFVVIEGMFLFKIWLIVIIGILILFNFDIFWKLDVIIIFLILYCLKNWIYFNLCLGLFWMLKNIIL